jgi:hypothetical protein
MLTPNFVRFIPPAHSDEAALELSQLLRQLSQRFDECFRQQIRRAQRVRRKKPMRPTEKSRPYAPQSKLSDELYARPASRGHCR